jgi:hypothetical protein
MNKRNDIRQRVEREIRRNDEEENPALLAWELEWWKKNGARLFIKYLA